LLSAKGARDLSQPVASTLRTGGDKERATERTLTETHQRKRKHGRTNDERINKEMDGKMNKRNYETKKKNKGKRKKESEKANKNRQKERDDERKEK
jgi:hypothetical protein